MTYRELTSVGIDIGTTTSHLVFSRLVLERDSHSRTQKFVVSDRVILHTGPIHLTPFIDGERIDFERLREMFLRDYSDAGFTTDDIDTGAVIITGETARKENAEDIVNAVAGESGKFVAATAGPNYEAVLAAHGSGAVQRSRATGRTILNVDIGGGTSKLAVCQYGRVVDTASINVGGRLVAMNDNGEIIRVEQGGLILSELTGIPLRRRTSLSENDVDILTSMMADSLLEVIMGNTLSHQTSRLMLTPPLQAHNDITEIAFSGGVAEYIYERESHSFGDLGIHLAKKIRLRLRKTNMSLVEPQYKIRATVIGAGQSSLQVSGSTTFLSAGLRYPIRNLPVVAPHITWSGDPEHDVAVAIELALNHMDMQEGEDSFILAFRDAVRPSYESITRFVRGVVRALPKTINSGRPIMMCFDSDVGNSVGNIMRRETGVTNELLSIDEVALEQGDYVDIGEPVIAGVVVPVVVKTLVFGGDIRSTPH